jgi:hypothetical protein
VLAELDHAPTDGSAVASYARAVAALAAGRDDEVPAAVATMRSGGEAFERTADALAALAAADRTAYDGAIVAIVADFEGREAHLTGVAIADTAVMLDRLASPRGFGGLPTSRVLPPA